MKLFPLALTVFSALPLAAAPPPTLQVEQREVVLFSIRPMTAAAADSRKTLSLRLDSTEAARGALTFDWPSPGSECRLEMAVHEQTGVLADARKVRLDAVLTLPDRTRVEASRELTVRGETTALFEIYRLGDRSLTLAIQAELDSETTFTTRPTATRPVQLQLEIDRLEGTDFTPLERNTLNTFLGRPVSYSFDLGGSDETDALKIVLLPLTLIGEILTMEVTLSGRIATDDGTEWTSRSQRVLSSVGIQTLIPVSAGTPPVGYRFRVTPRF